MKIYQNNKKIKYQNLSNQNLHKNKINKTLQLKIIKMKKY
jgi:hypothetical protein